MKKLLIYLSCLTMVSQFAIANTFDIDTNMSHIKWEGSKPTGKHNGKVQFKEGTITTKGSNVKSAMFVADMTSITCDDLTGRNNRKLVKHLKSKDFFDVANHPTAKFEFTRVDLMKGGKYQFKGTLTILGISKPIFFVADVDRSKSTIEANTSLTINRTDWGIKYKSKNFFKNVGDKLINDNMRLDIKLVANVKQEMMKDKMLKKDMIKSDSKPK